MKCVAKMVLNAGLMVVLGGVVACGGSEYDNGNDNASVKLTESEEQSDISNDQITSDELMANEATDAPQNQSAQTQVDEEGQDTDGDKKADNSGQNNGNNIVINIENKLSTDSAANSDYSNHQAHTHTPPQPTVVHTVSHPTKVVETVQPVYIERQQPQPKVICVGKQKYCPQPVTVYQ